MLCTLNAEKISFLSREFACNYFRETKGTIMNCNCNMPNTKTQPVPVT